MRTIKMLGFLWSIVFNIFKKSPPPEYLLLDTENNAFEFSGIGKFFFRGVHVISLEKYHLYDDKLVIEHFASHLNDELNVRVKGMGEPFLRFLAKVLLDKHPKINVIEFELYSTLSHVKKSPELLEKVKNARRCLLHRIGSRPVSVRQPVFDCYVVKGRWGKSKWLKT